MDEIEKNTAPPDGWKKVPPQEQPSAQKVGSQLPVGSKEKPKVNTINAEGKHLIYKVDYRSWGDNKKLDLLQHREGWETWKNRATSFLTQGRRDVFALLKWASEEGSAIAELKEEEAADVSHAVYDAIKSIIVDAMLPRAASCGEGRGLELWRRLHAEAYGSTPQVLGVKTSKFMQPERCSNTAALHEQLPIWRKLEEELKLQKLIVPDWVKINGLENLLPETLLAKMVAQSELETYSDEIRWVEKQIVHYQGNTHASLLAKAKGRANLANVEETEEGKDEEEAEHEEEKKYLTKDDLLAMGFSGSPKGKGKDGGGKGDDRKCWNCGGTGHIARGCHKPSEKGKGKGGWKGQWNGYDNRKGQWQGSKGNWKGGGYQGGKKGGKNQGKGFGWQGKGGNPSMFQLDSSEQEHDQDGWSYEPMYSLGNSSEESSQGWNEWSGDWVCSLEDGKGGKQEQGERSKASPKKSASTKSVNGKKEAQRKEHHMNRYQALSEERTAQDSQEDHTNEVELTDLIDVSNKIREESKSKKARRKEAKKIAREENEKNEETLKDKDLLIQEKNIKEIKRIEGEGAQQKKDKRAKGNSARDTTKRAEGNSAQERTVANGGKSGVPVGGSSNGCKLRKISEEVECHSLCASEGPMCTDSLCTFEGPMYTRRAVSRSRWRVPADEPAMAKHCGAVCCQSWPEIRGGTISPEINSLEDAESLKSSGATLAAMENKGPRWIKIEAAVDSGAVDPVINQEEVVPHLQVMPTDESERGETWTAAGGHEIKKMGEVVVPWMTNHGTMKRSRFKVGKVSRTLISVSRLNECGYEAILSKWWPRLIHHRSRETIPLRNVRGMFIIDMWIQVPGNTGSEEWGFTRLP